MMEVNENLYYLIRFMAETTCEPKAREVYEGRKIGLYLQNIKKGIVKISEEDAEFLNRLGVKLHTEDPKEKVHKKLLILVEFMYIYRRKPKKADYYKGVHLGPFFRNILSGNTSLSPEDRKKFDDVMRITQ